MSACKPSLDHQRGFALTEIILAVIVVAAATFGSFYLWSQADDKARMDKTVRDLSLIQAEMRMRYGAYTSLPERDYSVSLANDLRLNNPGDSDGAGGRFLTNAWGGLIGVQSHGDGTFSVRMQSLPRFACTRLAMTSAGGRNLFTDGIVAVASSTTPGEVFDIRQDGDLPVTRAIDMCAQERQDLTFTLAK